MVDAVGTSAANTEGGRSNPAPIEASPQDHEKRNSTSTRPEIPLHHSSPIPIEAPVLGGATWIAEPSEKAEHAATAFKHHQTLSPAHHEPHHEEKAVREDENGSARPMIPAEGISPDETEGEDEDEVVYPGGLQLGLLALGLCLATFTVALDNTIIATAIPKITSVFDSLNDVGWYGSSYLLTTTALQPSFGRIYTYFNVKWTYITALIIFEIGSILCAAAKNSVMLIVGRAVAGAGASALFSGGMTIVGFSVPLAKRPIFISLLSSMFGVSSVVGPLLGGVLTDKASWRWCFWINLPFGVISIFAVAFFFKVPKRKESGMTIKQRILEIDLLGALFLICAIVCLLLALQWGGTTYPWKNSKIWGLFLAFGLLIIVFIALQIRRGDRATIPPRILKQRTVWSACAFSCFLSMALYVHIFYLPFYFQAVKGTTAEGSGIRTIPYLASIILSSIAIGASISHWGWYQPFMVASGVVFTIGAGMLYTLKVNSNAGVWVGYQLLAGFGAGAGIQIPFVAVQVVLNSKDMPSGNAMTIFANSLGGAIAISIAQNIFSNGLTKNLPIDAPNVDPRVVISAGATYLRGVVSAVDLPGVLIAYNTSLRDAFVISIVCGGIATITALFVESKNVKGKSLMPGGAA